MTRKERYQHIINKSLGSCLTNQGIEDYYYSSAKFYETNIPNFEFLKHLFDVF